MIRAVIVDDEPLAREGIRLRDSPGDFEVALEGGKRRRMTRRYSERLLARI